ncbi:MAG: mechanosensitive ion channel family protein [Candidatus Omnitrophica bacterium]|nr:mechanosensitive ion channel family protein [Candidatus Omnitrophota bacterium]MBU4488090.1 mechanosensitive ion channel family protein [Candidatus Omnitrophota bacterium]MCG2705604.1 mechanosensitive ion channel family protein [Candidatus Omnitrophota bacterium]
MKDIYFSIILIATAAFTGVIIRFILSFIIKKFRGPADSWKRLLGFRYLIGPVSSLIPAACLLSMLPMMHFPEDIKIYVIHILQLWVIASVGWFIIKATYIVRDVILSRYKMDERDNLQARAVYTQIRVIGDIINVAIAILTVSIMMMTFDKIRHIGVSLLASAGVIGIIIGFAAQKTLGSLLAGIQIAIAQPIRIDDVVIVEGEWGWIEEITLTYVVVRIWDLRRLVVPISYFIEKPFQNWTRISADLLGYIYLYVDYAMPVQEVRDELTRILSESHYWDKKVNVLQVTNITERTIELRALMSAADSPSSWNLRCEVREKLLVFLQKKFPQFLPRVRVEMEKET